MSIHVKATPSGYSPQMPRMWTWRFFLVVVLVFLSSGCYIPDDFAIDIRLTRNGDYAFRFEGTVLAVALAEKLDKGEFSDSMDPQSDTFSENIAIYQRDLSQVKKFEDVEYLGEARFRIRNLYASNVMKSSYFVFMTRLNRILTLQYSPQDQTISLIGGSMQEKDIRRLTNADVRVKGRVRVISDLPLVSQNATRVLNTRTPSYEWFFDGFAPRAPFIVFRFSPPAADPKTS